MQQRRAERDPGLQRLSLQLGIETRYRDQSGEWREVPDATLHALCTTLRDTKVGRDGAAASPPVIVVQAGGRTLAPVLRRIPDVPRLHWELRREDGGVAGGTSSRPGLRDALRPGYHRLELRWREGRRERRARTSLIAVPARAYLPLQLRNTKVWGLAAQLYGLKSQRNWGIGDFSDLEDLILQAAGLGADVVGVNPLHALFPDDPERASPYSPSSRLFVNPIYLDLEAIEDLAECPEAQRLIAGKTAALRQRLQQRPLVDYAGVTRLKRQILELLYRSFRERHLDREDGPRAAAFRDFQRAGGTSLRRFATFHALREKFVTAGRPQAWRDWPAAFRDPASQQVASFVRQNVREIERIEYEQWQAQRQLSRAARTARDLAMGIGLYQDLAVGFDPDGADAWSLQGITAEGWTIGAPPDAWSPSGQDWGLAPLNPRRLRDAAFAPLIETLRANMRQAGALRIDHVLGLQRFFWVPKGGSPADGAYVRYPFDDLVGIVALESQRHRCVVVGEDLGTVPPGFSEALQRRGVLSYRLLYFSRTRRGGFEAPRRYPAGALAAVSTHDLPTLAGYWRGDDIALRERLQLYPDARQASRDRTTRAQDRRALLAAFKAERLPVDGREAPVDTAHRFLARTSARIAMAQIEDLLGLHEQANLPGTVTQHPNWRRKLPVTLEDLSRDATFRRHAAVLAAERAGVATRTLAGQAPRATYRLQLNRDFTFAAATAALPFLARMGISHLYLSPVLEAQEGSTHGYDTTSFDRLNPELGGAEGFRALSDAARAHGLRVLVDFVPNHMGIGQARNEWWLDLLEWGQHSPAARIFDIDWAPVAWPELNGKLTVPLLGDSYESVLDRGELRLRFDAQKGTLAVWYHSHCFPVHPAEYAAILAPAIARLQATPHDRPATVLARIAADFGRLAGAKVPRERAQTLKAALVQWSADNPKAAALIQPSLDSSFGNGSRALDQLLRRQVYRLALWRTAAREINYRRFFDINQLASLGMERQEVFERCHGTIAQLIADDRIHGIRLDHVDGLYDPGEYCRQLRRLAEESRAASGKASPPFYLLVEKILGADETLRRNWSVDGTTGYEAANWLNGLLVDRRGAAELTRIYGKFSGRTTKFGEELRSAKRYVTARMFGGELTALAARIERLLETSQRVERESIASALQDVIVEVPVYRSYISQRRTTSEDTQMIAAAVKRATRHGEVRDQRLLRALEGILTTRAAARARPRVQAELRDIAIRFQQLTAPVQAKSLEDTAFYRYMPLLSVNEVGGDPGRPGLTTNEFHARLRRQARELPHSMVATATHDTKRGEDARARISVLSEVPGEWRRQLAQWSSLNRSALTDINGDRAPSANDEYLLYQTLLGAWPVEFIGVAAPEAPALAAFRDRIVGFVEKAVREAKLRSSWLEPDPAYEGACRHFVERILDPRRSRGFLGAFSSFAARVARLGALNSLSQTALKLTVPGVPDIYRGCELWDLSLVDPDNRRPFSIEERSRHLLQLASHDPAALIPQLARDWRSGQIKLYVIWRLLALRRAEPALFASGSYEPLTVSGPAAEHVVAFRRRAQGRTIIVAVSRHFARFTNASDGLTLRKGVWHRTRLRKLGHRGEEFVDVLTGRPIAVQGSGDIELDDLFGKLPVAVLTTPRG